MRRSAPPSAAASVSTCEQYRSAAATIWRRPPVHHQYTHSSAMAMRLARNETSNERLADPHAWSHISGFMPKRWNACSMWFAHGCSRSACLWPAVQSTTQTEATWGCTRIKCVSPLGDFQGTGHRLLAQRLLDEVAACGLHNGQLRTGSTRLLAGSQHP